MIDPTTGTTPEPEPIPTPVLNTEIPSIVQREPKVICPNCRMEVTVEPASSSSEINCSYCSKDFFVEIFPRLTEEPQLALTGDIAGGEDATCQFYPELKAEIVCDECGCFMSEKAAINWGGRNLCMPCLHNLRENKANTDYRARLKIWDNRALGFISMLPLTLFTAPLALFLLIRFRKEPRGWIPRSSFRWWLAMGLTILILIGWTALIVVWVAMLTREMAE